MHIPIQPASPTTTLYQQEPSYNNTTSRPQNHTDISRNTLPMNMPPQLQQQQHRNAIPMNMDPSLQLQPQPQPQFQLQPQQPRHPDPIADLASYISDPKTERIARLGNWICSQIQNDDFISLAEDVEGLWQRFAFGRMWHLTIYAWLYDWRFLLMPFVDICFYMGCDLYTLRWE